MAINRRQALGDERSGQSSPVGKSKNQPDDPSVTASRQAGAGRLVWADRLLVVYPAGPAVRWSPPSARRIMQGVEPHTKEDTEHGTP